MRVLMIAPNDPAGAAINLLKALRAHGGVDARLVTVTRRYDFRFERDIYVPDLCRRPDCDAAVLGPPTRGCVGCPRPAELGAGPYEEIRQLIRDADVVHFHVLANEQLQIGPLLVQDHLRPGTEIVHHHHGHPDFRANPVRYRTRYAVLGRRTLVSTPDLLRLLPEATWIPNCVPTSEPLYRPFEGERDPSRVVLSHSPTVRALKNTHELVTAVERVRATDPRLELELLEGMRHRECLERKRRSDLCFDHMQGYFGMSSLEALSQGVPTIAGLDQWNKSEISDFFGCESVPWLRARHGGELTDLLRRLAADPAQREAIGRNSRAFMENVWTEQRVAQGLIEFYEAGRAVSPRLAHG